MAEASNWPLANVARLYYATDAAFAFDRLRTAAGEFRAGDIFAIDPDHALGAQAFDDVHEHKPAVVTLAVDPARQANRLASVVGAERAAGAEGRMYPPECQGNAPLSAPQSRRLLRRMCQRLIGQGPRHAAQVDEDQVIGGIDPEPGAGRPAPAHSAVALIGAGLAGV
eukprot:gene64286-87921_t